MRDQLELREFANQHRTDSSLVLCTLIRKSGSSYRGLGAKKWVTDSAACGLLSGGCLEGSIEKAARERRAEMPFVQSFSTLSEEDRLLGYQTGCQGVIELLFEHVGAKPNFDLTSYLPFGIGNPFAGVCISLAPESLGERHACESAPSTHLPIFFDPWVEQIQLHIFGCGADAPPYGELARSLGWSCHFWDYRSDLARPERFAGHPVTFAPLPEIAARLPRGPRSAVVMMTHNYEADLEWLSLVGDAQWGYLGCLGPAVRFERLRADLREMYGQTLSAAVEAVAAAPAGLFPHSRSPSDIALSVLAQIQERLVESPPPRVWTLIAAAGASTRFGSPKALAKWSNGTLLSNARAQAARVSGENVVVVTGAADAELRRELGEAHAHFNSEWQKGMGQSLAAGARFILQKDPHVDVVVIWPVDQPLIAATHVRKLVAEAARTGRCALTSDAEKWGPPAAVPRRFLERLTRLTGEAGLKSVLSPAEWIAVDNPKALRDVDTPDDLVRLERDHQGML